MNECQGCHKLPETGYAHTWVQVVGCSVRLCNECRKTLVAKMLGLIGTTDSDPQPTIYNLVGQYANVVGKFGPDSPEVQKFRAAHADNKELMDYTESLDRMKRGFQKQTKAQPPEVAPDESEGWEITAVSRGDVERYEISTADDPGDIRHYSSDFGEMIGKAGSARSDCLKLEMNDIIAGIQARKPAKPAAPATADSLGDTTLHLDKLN